MSWDRIRGHDAVRRQFEAAARRGRLGQAYLFVGPDGVGKRLFATELAKALFCDAPPAPLAACDRCPSCVQVAANSHPDFFTARKPDDKLELPVDTVREFAANFGRKPARGARKVGVLEDADSFNEESANCFLKTLEEPPPGGLLVLLATSAESQLATILSRCQPVRFNALAPADVRAVLADNEITDPARVEKLVRLAGGSAGQALALNDDALWEFRDTLASALADPKPDPTPLAAAWSRFIEEAGKESAAQRGRASLVVRLLLDILAAAARAAVGADPGPGDGAAVGALAGRFGPDGLVELMEACVEADRHIERRVQLVLVTERLADQLCRPA